MDQRREQELIIEQRKQDKEKLEGFTLEEIGEAVGKIKTGKTGVDDNMELLVK